MLRFLRERGQHGQAVVLLALAMVGLLAIVGLALDGGMMFWNQRRAQNGADAGAISGATTLVNQFLDSGLRCGGSEADVLARVNQYTANNEVPNASANTHAFYLTEDGAGNRVVLLNASNQPWEVGTSADGKVPCLNVVGIHVTTSFPQETFLAGIVGIAQTNVTVEASATWTFHNWCTDFIIYGISQNRKKFSVSLTGAGITISGAGVHSSGGIQIGGGGQDITFDDGVPIEYGVDGDVAIDESKIIGEPEIGPAPYDPLPSNFFYSIDDFRYEGKPCYNAPKVPVHDFGNASIGKNDVKDADGKLIDGVYITDGKIDLNNLGNLGGTDKIWTVTLVAKGPIAVSGGINQQPAICNVFAYSTYDGRPADGHTGATGDAISFSGSDNSIEGMLVAPYGKIDLSAAKNSNFAGQFVGWEVDIAGSDNQFYYQPGYCPFDPPNVILIH